VSTAAHSFLLSVDNARARMRLAWDVCCQYLELGQAVTVSVEQFQNRRSLVQNAKFHAICGELAKSTPWAGAKRDTEAWKRLLVDAWARVTERSQGQIVPSLDGSSVVALGIQTRTLKVKDMAELIEFAQSWCVDHDVELSQ